LHSINVKYQLASSSKNVHGETHLEILVAPLHDANKSWNLAINCLKKRIVYDLKQKKKKSQPPTPPSYHVSQTLDSPKISM
jgi:hypothetical protein